MLTLIKAKPNKILAKRLNALLIQVDRYMWVGQLTYRMVEDLQTMIQHYNPPHEVAVVGILSDTISQSTFTVFHGNQRMLRNFYEAFAKHQLTLPRIVV